MKLYLKGRNFTGHYKPFAVRAVRFERICAATGIFFFIPLVSTPESRCGRFCAGQGLIVLFLEILGTIACLLASLILGLLAKIPIIGVLFAIAKVLFIIAVIAVLVAYIAYGIYYAAKDKVVEIPLFGRMRFIK